MIDSKKLRACVVVLGDWGRSPRMQYHALSLTKHGFHVDVVAYEGSDPHDDVKINPSITHHLLKVPEFYKYVPKILSYILKGLWLSFILLKALICIDHPDLILLQNPPSIPTLPICWFVCLMRKSKLVIDFHNYGFTILGLSLGHKNIIVRLYKGCEKYFGGKAHQAFCVSKAMKEDLAENWGVRSDVFYDCPPKLFHPIDIKEKHSLFQKLGQTYKQFKSRTSKEIDNLECTRFTEFVNGHPEVLLNRPALLVSGTSWTEDEDFSVLLEALEVYDKAAVEMKELPNLVVAITGKGPLRETYEKIIKEKNLMKVEIITLWLAAEDYPTLLACADLGVCLHTSTSGLDLPMKVVDMLGTGLPVCAISYQCIHELVKNGINGRLFANSTELSKHLQDLLEGFPTKSMLKIYRQNISKFPLPRWDDNWNNHVLPKIQELMT